jgi:glycosyltransferase involved in cell wall biosynthesis
VNNLFFLSPDDNSPVGGIKVLYRHVDILNQNGFQAAIVHKKKGFRCTWFENQTRVEYRQNLQPDPFDFAVIPEIHGPRLAEMVPLAKKVVFNQNAYLTFREYSFDPQDLTTAYRDPGVVAALVVSEDSRRYLSYVFPELKVYRVHLGVDVAKFRFRELAQKRRQIAFMVRKHVEDARQVINILKFRGMLDGWEIAAIENLKESDVAQVLEESLVFLSFGYPEGFGLPALEAMLCGCLVAGYHGNGGREVLRPEISWPVEAGDIMGFARVAENLLRQVNASPSELSRKTAEAREFVSREYSMERERQDVLKFWDEVRFEQGHDAIAEA